MNQRMRPFVLTAFVAAGTATAHRAAPAGEPSGVDFPALGREVVAIVRDQFLDAERAKAWADRHADYARAMRNETAFAARTNEVLAELETSHTQYYRPNEAAYWGIAAIFAEYLSMDDVVYESAGIDVNSRHFIRSVYADSPAARAGLKRGDRILSADGKPFEPINSFIRKTKSPVKLMIERSARSPPIEVDVVPRTINPKAEWLEAQRAGARIIPRADVNVAYAPMYWTVDEDFRALIQELIAVRFREADVLILDFRDGFGGSNPEFLNYFNHAPPHIELLDRKGKARSFDPQWRKPLVVLINGGTRSGKEIVAHALKQQGLATLVGERTAGFVVGGRPYLLSDRSLLYVAVMDSTVDGKRLEGVGVTPHVVVPDRLEYAAGADPQLDRAIELACELARTETKKTNR